MCYNDIAVMFKNKSSYLSERHIKAMGELT